MKNAKILFLLGLLIGTGFLACGIVELVTARRYAKIHELPIFDERKPQLQGSSFTKNVMGGIFVGLAVGVFLATSYIPFYWYRIKRRGDYVRDRNPRRVITDLRFVDRRRNTGQQEAEVLDGTINEESV